MRRSLLVLVILAVLLGALLLSAGCSDTSAPPTAAKTAVPTTAQVKGVQVRIIYPGSWQGAIGYDGNVKSVEGTGSMVYTLTEVKIVSITAQKMDAGSVPLQVEILKNGKVIKSETTTAAYGVAMTSTVV